MMIVGSPEQTEALLLAGEIPCPDCSVQLRPHGHARTRTVRGQGDERLTLQPRRARCTSCRRTQVLLPAALSVRRADAIEVIGTALAAKAAGDGYRTIAARMGRPLSTVRRWLRRVPEKHAHWLYEQAVQHAFRLDPEILVRPKRWPSLLGWSLNVLAGAALAHRRWVGTDLPPWTLIGLFTRGRRCRIPAFVKLQKSIVKHRDSILASIRHKLSNGRIESMNTKIRLITRVAFGFKSPEALIGLAMLSLGGQKPVLPGRE